MGTIGHLKLVARHLEEAAGEMLPKEGVPFEQIHFTVPHLSHLDEEPKLHVQDLPKREALRRV